MLTVKYYLHMLRSNFSDSELCRKKLKC